MLSYISVARQLRSLPDELANQREKEAQQRTEHPGEYDDLRARQAAAHTREDIAGLVYVATLTLGEIRSVKYTLYIVVVLLAYLAFKIA